MKRLNRQKLLTAFEEARNGFNQAHMKAAEHGDEVLMACMEAHHFGMNNMIVELGGERVQLPDLKQFLENAEVCQPSENQTP